MAHMTAADVQFLTCAALIDSQAEHQSRRAQSIAAHPSNTDTERDLRSVPAGDDVEGER